MRRKDKTIGIRKMEVDEKTSKIKIVKSKERYDNTGIAEMPAEPVKDEKINQSSIGKQIVMQRILGFKHYNSVAKRQKIFKIIVTSIFITFVLAVLGFTFYKDFFAHDTNKVTVSWEGLIGNFEHTWFYLLFAIFALFCSYLFKGTKLAVICKSQTGKSHFKTCFETGIIGHYYNNVTPWAVGGQPFEIYHLSKHGVHGGVAASMPIIAFFLSQLAFVILGIVSFFLLATNALGIEEEFIKDFPTVFNIFAVIGLVACIAAPAFVLLSSLFPRAGATITSSIATLGGKLRIVKNPKLARYKSMKTMVHTSSCIKKFAKSPLALAASFALSLGETLAQCSIAYFTLKLFGYDNLNARGIVEWLQIVQLSIILYASISVIPTPGNSGAADLSFYALFAVGVKYAGLAFTAMVLWRIISYYSYIIIGFIFTTATHKKNHLAEFLGIIDLEN